MTEEAAGRLGRLNGRVTTWLARAAAFVLAALAVMTFCDVIGRYFFNAPFSFSVEMTELSMGLVVYLAIGLTTHENGHVSVDFVTTRLRERVRAAVEVLTGLAAFAFLALLVWRLALRAQVLFEKGDYTQIVGFPIWPVAVAMAAGSVFLLTGVLLHAVRALRRAARSPGA